MNKSIEGGNPQASNMQSVSSHVTVSTTGKIWVASNHHSLMSA